VSDSIEQQIIDIVATKKKLDPSSISAASRLDELGLDSLDAADLLFTVEDTFGIVVPDDAATSMKSIGDIIAGVRRLQATRAGAS
jgi:acyl carrier protein